MTQSKYLGASGAEFSGFDTFPVAEGVTRVAMSSDEVTALCPVTGHPDQYQVEIEYIPRELALESKSLKLYFQTFRNEGIFCESFAARIADDVHEAIKARSVDVRVTQKPRGGITIVAHARAGDDRENLREG
jgi:7-cyano-7-deazaguanine reductase